MHNPEGMYFVSFAVVDWIDVFVRRPYFQIVADSLNYCIKEKSMFLYGYCIMTSHIHLIFASGKNEPTQLLKEFKTYTSKTLLKSIQENDQESKQEWMLRMMKENGAKTSNVKNFQFWQHHNKPIELWTNTIIDQKLDYLHDNPVVAGFVDEPHHWLYSSARDYSGVKGMVEVTLVG